jgi:ABC-type sugar transport system permease subunit
LTGGGPLGATEFLALYTYRTALNGRFELGYASALGMIALAIYALFTASYLRWRKS